MRIFYFHDRAILMILMTLTLLSTTYKCIFLAFFIQTRMCCCFGFNALNIFHIFFALHTILMSYKFILCNIFMDYIHRQIIRYKFKLNIKQPKNKDNYQIIRMQNHR